MQSQQQIIAFKHKADLNEETFKLIRTFIDLQEYKIIAFSTSKESTMTGENRIADAIGTLKKKFLKESKVLKSDHKMTNDTMDILQDS